MAKIRIRRGTALEWVNIDPILADGEMGYVKNTGQLKIGNGIDSWVSLNYFNPSTAPDLTAYLSKPVTDGSIGQVLKIKSLSPLVTEWASGGGGGGGDMLKADNLAGIADPNIARANIYAQAYTSVLQATTASFTTGQEVKLAGIATGAQVNPSGASILSSVISTATGTASAATALFGDGSWKVPAGGGGGWVKGTTVDLTNSTTDRAAQIKIYNDASASSGWINRFEFYYERSAGVFKRTSYFNEYGELRIASALPNTVPLRLFQREYDTDPSRDMAVPLFQIYDDRVSRISLMSIMPDGSINAPKINAVRSTTYTAKPAGSYLDTFTLNYAIDVNNPDMQQVNVLRGASLFKTLWRNEWGAIRGTSPYTWGDAMIRALRDNGDGITTGQAIELGDRRTTKTNGSIMWGVRWTDGQMIQADQVVGAVYKTTAATSDAAILALNLPAGTLIVNMA